MIKIDKNGTAIVSDHLKIKLHQVWNAIYLNYFYISNKNMNQASKKLQRWWRKASGFHYGFDLEEPYDLWNILPPILYRQSHQCEPPVTFNEIPYYKQNGIAISRNTRRLPWSNFDVPDDPIICYKQRNMIIELKIINGWVCKNTPKRFNKRSFQPEMSKEHIYNLAKQPGNIHRNPYKKFCCCSDTKSSDYIRAVNHNKNYIIKIFTVLAKDNINVKTRMKLSNFLRYRLS